MHAQVGILALSAGEFRSDIRARGVMNPDLVTIGMMLETSGGVSQWDYDIIPGDIVVVPKSVEQEGRFTGYSSYVTITLSAEDLATHATGERHLQEPEFWAKIYRFRPSPSLRNSARLEIGKRILQLRAGEVPLSRAGIDYLRRSLLEAFLHGIIEEALDDHDERHFPGARLVHDVEDYVDAAGAISLCTFPNCVPCSACRVARCIAHSTTRWASVRWPICVCAACRRCDAP